MYHLRWHQAWTAIPACSRQLEGEIKYLNLLFHEIPRRCNGEVHFKRWGDVQEIFISKQRNKRGRRYGFVRFRGVSDVRKLERKLDNPIVDGLKLYVNVPKYERGKGRQAQRRTESKVQRDGGSQGTIAPHQTQIQHKVPSMSCAKILLTNTMTSGQRRKSENASSKQAGSQSSVHIDIPTGTTGS